MTTLDKAVLLAAVALFGAASADAQSALLTLPDLSQHARLTQRIGLTDITIDYHRPLVAGRKIFGALEPYGEVWRAGANYNTTFEISDSLRVEGHVLPKGVYGLHMIPGASSWVIIFSNNSTSWGSFTYDSTEDALRVRVAPQTIPHVEALTYSFDDPKPSSVVLTMRWDNVAVPVRMEIDTPHLVAQRLRLQLRGRAQTEWQAWEEVANYLLENSLDASEALRYANQSIQIEDRFENEVTRARALRALGRAAEADSAQAKAITMGSQAQVYSFARTLQRLGQQRAALQIFLQDSRKHPGTWTSHLEAARIAVAASDYPQAIVETKAAITLAPTAMKAPLEQVLVQLQNGVDINREVRASDMTVRDTIESYYERLGQRAGWDAVFADDVAFTNFASPVRRVAGKEAFLQATRRFYGSVGSLEVRELVVDGAYACALVRYEVQPPNGAPPFESHVAEFFTVDDGKIGAFAICFDTAPYPKS